MVLGFVSAWSERSRTDFDIRISDFPEYRALHVDYRFTDADGTPRQEHDAVDPDWPVPENRHVAVQFISGVEDASRIAGHRNLTLGLHFSNECRNLRRMLSLLLCEASDKIFTHRPLSGAYRRRS